MATGNIGLMDYTQIKTDLKAWLQSNYPEFADLNFEGSTLSMLISLLAYNSQHAALIANAAINEAFLSTAQKRSNVVLRARELGYQPATAKAATATVAVSFVRSDLTAPYPQITVDKGTKFSTVIDGKSYYFQTVSPVTVSSTTGTYTTNLDIWQGSFISYYYTVSNPPTNKYTLPASSIDTRFLTVTVKESVASASGTIWVQATDVNELDGTSEVFWIEENTDGNYDLVFGDGVVGKSLTTGNQIIVEYFLTAGAEANGAKTFARMQTIGGSSTATVTTVSVAAGGSSKESTDSIRLLAPLELQAQSRAATVKDYIVVLKREFSDLDDVTVWGGEDNLPYPAYGKVFVAIKPKENVFISQNMKEHIKNFILKKYNIVSIRPEIVDPEYLFVVVNTNVYYNSAITSLTAEQIKNKAVTAIQNFFDVNLNLFGKKLNYSRLTGAVDSSDSSVSYNTTTLKIRSEKTIIADATTNYSFDFSNAIEPYSVASNAIVVDGVTYYIDDVPTGTAPYSTGVLRIYRKATDGSTIFLKSNAGTVNYVTGAVALSSVRISSTSDSLLKITVAPARSVNLVAIDAVDNNISTNKRQQIITINPADIIVTANAESA